MASAPSSPPAIAQPGPAPPGLQRARWHYVDEARTHEVFAGVRPASGRDGLEFVIREGPYQNEDPAASREEVTPLDATWEARLVHWQLECRLAKVGRYWRDDTQRPGWRPLTTPQGAPEVDTREVRVGDLVGRVVLYHFHHLRQREDRVVIAIPRDHPQGKRWLLAEARFTFPNAEDGEIALVHAQLVENAAKGHIVARHIALKEKGYEKLVWGQDYLRIHGKEWERETSGALRAIVRRIAEGRFGVGKTGSAELVVDEFYTDFYRALTDPRVTALHARYLAEGEEAKLLKMGEVAIKRAIAQKRHATPREEQHLLTILEASLLARDQLSPGRRRVDPEVAALVRRFAYYL